ncbi:hypothetical protein B0H19DRAFT_1231264, partial [Mycena capillaripes]
MHLNGDDTGIRGGYISPHNGTTVASPSADPQPHHLRLRLSYAPTAPTPRQRRSSYVGASIPCANRAPDTPNSRQRTGVPRLAGIPDAQPHPHPHPQSRRRPIALPPQIHATTTVILHPALAKSGTPLAIDFASLPTTESNAAWYHLLSTPATHPGLPSLTILAPSLPWAITAHASGSIVRCLTVADVMGAIWAALSLRIDAEQFEREMTTRDMTTRGGSHSPKRRNKAVESGGLTYWNGMTRLDLLQGKTRFAGLSESTMGCDTWVLEGSELVGGIPDFEDTDMEERSRIVERKNQECCGLSRSEVAIITNGLIYLLASASILGVPHTSGFSPPGLYFHGLSLKSLIGEQNVHCLTLPNCTLDITNQAYQPQYKESDFVCNSVDRDNPIKVNGLSVVALVLTGSNRSLTTPVVSSVTCRDKDKNLRTVVKCPRSRGVGYAEVRASSPTQTVRLNYGHLIGINTEINLLWRRRKSLSAYWFYINRYFGCFSGIAVSALPFLTLSLETCINYSFFREVVIVVTQTIASIVMIIRVYALYGRSRRVLWFLLVMGFSVVAVSVYSFTQQHASRPMILGGCQFNLSENTSYRLAGSWEGLFIFDTTIFLLTIYNAHTTRRRMIPTANLYTLVVRDGALYFRIMALANLANIASYYFANSG